MKTIIPFTILAFVCLCSCNNVEERLEIEAVDFLGEMNLDTVNGETQSQTFEKSRRVNTLIFNKTNGRYLPKNIKVQNTQGETFYLNKLITRETIIVSSDFHCGFGRESVANIFPKVRDSLFLPPASVDVICLLIERTDIDDTLMSENWLYEQCSRKYGKDLYLIQDSVANRINMFSNPTRIYVNADAKVLRITGGMLETENQIAEVASILGD